MQMPLSLFHSPPAFWLLGCVPVVQGQFSLSIWKAFSFGFPEMHF